MPGDVYVSRLLKLPVLTADGDTIGRTVDLVLVPPAKGDGPRLLGIVAAVSRRRIFIGATKVADVAGSGVALRSTALDLRPFELRVGELLASTLLDRPRGAEGVLDVALRRRDTPDKAFEVSGIVLGRKGVLGRARSLRTIPWEEARDLFDLGEAAAEVAELRAMHPADLARALRDLPQRRQEAVVEAFDDEDLADVLEELPEADQASILGGLDVERAARVLEEMEPDDAADLLSELAPDQRRRLLGAMDPEEADPLRRLLLYEGHTAGGLMTPEPVVLTPDATVAEALARARDDDIPAAVAACVFVVQPPTQTPTGPYLGALTFQTLLREPPSSRLGTLVDGTPAPVDPALPEIEVAERLAEYNLLSLPVCDAAGSLLGAVTVDDVLDRTLPAGWRTHT